MKLDYRNWPFAIRFTVNLLMATLACVCFVLLGASILSIVIYLLSQLTNISPDICTWIIIGILMLSSILFGVFELTKKQ